MLFATRAPVFLFQPVSPCLVDVDINMPENVHAHVLIRFFLGGISFYGGQIERFVG